jgi:opacity protein-like surface antigen
LAAVCALPDMKSFTLAAIACLLAAGVAGAQDVPRAPLVRGDAHFVIGWQNLHKEQPQQHYNDWLNAIFYGGAGAGWYWTENLKTQVDFGAGTQGHQYRYAYTVTNGQTTSSSSRVDIRQQSLAVAQRYQFFRNQWFHPHVGAGVDIARETTTEQYQSVVLYDNATRTSTQITPARTEGPDHRMIVRPFAETGFKAYMTRRTFFTGDTRVMFRTGIDEVLFRFGFGVDF